MLGGNSSSPVGGYKDGVHAFRRYFRFADGLDIGGEERKDFSTSA